MLWSSIGSIRNNAIFACKFHERGLPLSPPSILAPMLRPRFGAPMGVRRGRLREGATWEPVLKEEIGVNAAPILGLN